MIINFRQGIIKYPSNGGVQQFLGRNGANISLLVNDRQRVDVTFADGSQNYLYTEIATVTDAWLSIPNSVDVWLYWDLNVKTGVRTFGSTLLQPAYGPVRPTTPVEDQHWFDTIACKLYVYSTSGGWIRKIRTFAAKVNTSTFTHLGPISPLPFAGTQVGLTNFTVDASYIVYDELAQPIVRTNGEFLTLNSDMFVRGSSISHIKLEANAVQLLAAEPIARFNVVRLSDFDHISSASYENLTTSVCGISLEDLEPDELGLVVFQGVVTNPEWDWTTPGAYLWAYNGVLTETDYHMVDAVTYPRAEPPIARVLSPVSIIVTQINDALAADKVGRVITGTANQITVVNGDGLSGDPTISITNSANLPGSPTTSTAPPNTASSRIATTAYVDTAVAVKTVAGKTGNVVLAVGDISGAAPLESPLLTGIPAAPTAAPGTNTTQIATTAFVTAALSGVSGAITVLDEGVTLSTAVTSMDFVGSSVNVTNVGGAVTVTLSGGGGVTIADDVDTDAVFYPMLAPSTTGGLSQATVSSWNLQFVPYTGRLYAKEVSTSSDVTLKTNIRDIMGALETVEQWRGKTFMWADTGIASSGVIAQEVERSTPELVSTSPSGTKSVNYQAMTAYLIEAIRELNTRLQAVEGK